MDTTSTVKVIDSQIVEVTYTPAPLPTPDPVVERYTLDIINEKLAELAVADQQSDSKLASAQALCDSEKAEHAVGIAKFTDLQKQAIANGAKTRQEVDDLTKIVV
jgi:hypothetical protein